MTRMYSGMKAASEHIASQERVSVYHGSINHANEINSQGLDAGRLPVWVTRELRAARNAIDPILRADAVRDPGIIEADIPRDELGYAVRSQ